MPKIFIQIASYRDPELLPTIQDCIRKANNPENLVFGIANQYYQEDKWEGIDSLRKNRQFRILDIPALESLGTCWARYLVQRMYQGEEYTLQLDSHHRFVKNWDTILISMLESLRKDGIEKPGMVTQDANGEYIVDPDAQGEVDNKLRVGAKVKLAQNTAKQSGPSKPSKPTKHTKPSLPGTSSSGGTSNTSGAIL